MTLTVADLIPGDVVQAGGSRGTFVASTRHPVWPSLQLVIWRLGDGTWSLDALNAQQDVGELVSDRSDGRQIGRVRQALTGKAGLT